MLLMTIMTIKQEKEENDVEDEVEAEEEEDDDDGMVVVVVVVVVVTATASNSILETTKGRQKRDGARRFFSFPTFSKWTSFLLSATYNTVRLHKLGKST